MTNNMSEEELRKAIEEIIITDDYSHGVQLKTIDKMEQLIKQYTLSKQIEARKQVLNLLEANLSLAGWGDDISARKLWANMNQLRKQQEELK